jgi:hypothetical protein
MHSEYTKEMKETEIVGRGQVFRMVWLEGLLTSSLAYDSQSSPQINKGNPTCKGNILGTQLDDRKVECLGCLSGTQLRSVCCGRTVLLKKDFVESICNLGAIDVGNGPESDEIAIKAETGSQLTT